MDYLRYWSLQSSPFLQRDGNLFFSGPKEREAIAKIESFIGGERRFGVLQAEPGCGSTRFLQHLSLRVGFGDHAVQVILTGGNATCDQAIEREFVSSWLGRRVPGDQLGLGIEILLQQYDVDSVRIVWLIDRCGTFVANRACELARSHKQLRVIAAMDSRSRHLGSWQCRESQRLVTWGEMSFEDAVAYVSWAIRLSGNARKIFTVPAISHLHEISGGRIRDFSVLAEQSLQVGFAKRSSIINSAVIELAARSLLRGRRRAA